MNGRPREKFRDPSKPPRDIYEIQGVHALAWQIYLDNGGRPIELALDALGMTHESYFSQLNDCKIMRSQENSGGWGPTVSSHAASIAAGHVTRLVKERQHMMYRCMSEAEEHFEHVRLKREAEKARGAKPAAEAAGEPVKAHDPAANQSPACQGRDSSPEACAPSAKPAADEPAEAHDNAATPVPIESGEAVLDRLIAERFGKPATDPAGESAIFDGDAPDSPAPAGAGFADEMSAPPGENVFVDVIANMNPDRYPEEMRETMRDVQRMLAEEARKPIRVVIPDKLKKGRA